MSTRSFGEEARYPSPVILIKTRITGYRHVTAWQDPLSDYPSCWWVPLEEDDYVTGCLEDGSAMTEFDSLADLDASDGVGGYMWDRSGGDPGTLYVHASAYDADPRNATAFMVQLERRYSTRYHDHELCSPLPYVGRQDAAQVPVISYLANQTFGGSPRIGSGVFRFHNADGELDSLLNMLSLGGKIETMVSFG